MLSAYLQLFLHSSSALHHSDDVEAIMKSTLNTDFLGEYVGPQWGVGRVIRWTPSAPAHKLADMDRKVDIRRQVGLYKVQGEAVQAIIGGIYFQFVSECFFFLFSERATKFERLCYLFRALW